MWKWGVCFVRLYLGAFSKINAHIHVKILCIFSEAAEVVLREYIL